MIVQDIDPYDEFLYPNYSHPQTHPHRVASLATLLGMTPAPVENCRVLELACGDGSNLMPLAYGLPESRFLGIDRASQPIARGRTMVKALQLENLDLRQMDLMELPTVGEFDYIIAHGLYSWGPANLQDRILEICRSCLAPQGIAYVSYNVYPGHHLREITRDMAQFHTKDVYDPRERVAQARAVTTWAANAQTRSTAYSLFLRDVSEAFASEDDGAIYHDTLAEINTPIYFHEFLVHAGRHGLKFLSEAEYLNTQEHELAPEAAQHLTVVAKQDITAKEQYLDFLEGRSFRQTLLCHHEVELNRSFRPERIREFYLASQARPVSNKLDLQSTADERFRTPKQAVLTTNFPLAKAAIFHLSEIYPQFIRFDDLLAQAFRLLGKQPPLNGTKMNEASSTLAELLINTHGIGGVEFHMHAPGFTVVPGERPLASPLARLQAQQRSIITNLLGDNVRLEDLSGRQLLLLLDGTRDRRTLGKEFSTLIEATLQTPKGMAEVTDKIKFLEDPAGHLDAKLADFGRLGLLLA
jgi:methyltransferase-like protein/trans-aconitate methyltransferase